MRFRKKPVVIDAVQYNGGNFDEVRDFLGVGSLAMNPDGSFKIQTLEGSLKAVPGDWIIKGIRGQFYPCDPDFFEATYDPVEVE